MKVMQILELKVYNFGSILEKEEERLYYLRKKGVVYHEKFDECFKK